MPTRWHLATADLACELTLVDSTLRWQLARPGVPALTFAASPLAALGAEGRTFRWQRGQAVAQTDSGAARRLCVELTDVTESARLRVTVELFNDRPFARTAATLTNIGSAPLSLTAAELLHLALSDPEPLTLFHVEQFSWAYRRDFFSQHQVELVTGRAPLELRMGSFPSHHSAPSSCAWFAVRAGGRDTPDGDPIAAPGIISGIEFNGKSRLHAWRDTTGVRVTSTVDELAHTLAPGADFELPACFVGCFDGDWDEAGYATQRFAEAYVCPPMPDERYPWVQYNSWKYGQEIDEAQQLAVIERCADLGIEVVVVDLGWARQIGDWRPDPRKFPRGLRPLVESARARGMRFGVHLALAQMSPDAPAAHAHPNWLIHTDDDYFGAGPICLGHTPCRAWLTAEIIRLIDEEGIDYIIQDGEDMVKRCTRSDHTHAPGDSNYSNSTLGLDQVIATVRAARPHVVIENCEDGGCMLTFQMARLYDTSITVDNIATYATRQGIYGASYPFSPRYSVRYMQDDPTPYTLRSAIFGGPLILMHRITDWDERQMADTRAAVAEYKRLRALVRDAKIIHLLPPRTNLDGLGWGWDAIQAVSPDQSDAIVMVYRAQGGPETQTIRPRGLRAASRYRVSIGGATSEHSGAELAGVGVSVALAPFAAEIVSLEAL
ncbi:MAG: alpha-galactosidase [Chloroflexales bacterium]|nr:alpha-galactosidase [Chloroflexales bacterium]